MPPAFGVCACAAPQAPSARKHAPAIALFMNAMLGSLPVPPSGEEALVGGRLVDLLATLRRDHDDVFKMRAADVGAVRQHNARLEAHHHVLDDLEIDALVDQRFTVQAVPQLMTSVAAVEVPAPALTLDHFAGAGIDL